MIQEMSLHLNQQLRKHMLGDVQMRIDHILRFISR